MTYQKYLFPSHSVLDRHSRIVTVYHSIYFSALPWCIHCHSTTHTTLQPIVLAQRVIVSQYIDNFVAIREATIDDKVQVRERLLQLEDPGVL